jgi:HSP20 family protein
MEKPAKKTTRKKKAPATAQATPTEAADEQATTGRPVTPWQEMDRLFDEFLERRWPSMQRPEWARMPDWPKLDRLTGLLGERVPSVDVVDHDGEIVVRAEVPGVEKDDLDVSISDRTLTIKGSTRSETKDESGDYYRQEIKTGSFGRSVLLPADVDASKAKASFKDGVVELTLPKLASSKRKKIKVS